MLFSRSIHTTIVAAWQDACDLVLLLKDGTKLTLLCQSRSYVIDKLNRPVSIHPELGLVFPL